MLTITFSSPASHPTSLPSTVSNTRHISRDIITLLQRVQRLLRHVRVVEPVEKEPNRHELAQHLCFWATKRKRWGWHCWSGGGVTRWCDSRVSSGAKWKYDQEVYYGLSQSNIEVDDVEFRLWANVGEEPNHVDMNYNCMKKSVWEISVHQFRYAVHFHLSSYGLRQFPTPWLL